jgi:hypothetical protein
MLITGIIIKGTKNPRSIIPRLITLLGLSAIFYLTVTTAYASEVALLSPSGAVIKGLLVKKSEKQIEIQTEHGIVEIREKDLTPQAWDQAQRKVVSRPKAQKDTFVPKPREQKKEIKLSSKEEENKPVAVPYTGFIKENGGQDEAENDADDRYNNNSSSGSSTFFIGTQDDQNAPWKIEAQTTAIPDYKSLETSEPNPKPKTIEISLPQPNSLKDQVIGNSKRDAIRIFLPLTIVALSLVLLAKSTLPMRTKIASYLILGLLLLSIALENTLFGILAIGSLCSLMLLVEILNAKKRAIEEALNLPRNQRLGDTTVDEKEKQPNQKTQAISTYHLSLLEWKKFEEFICMWLEAQGFEVSRVKTNPTQSSNRIVEGYLPPKTRLAIDNAQNPQHPNLKKFKAVCKNTDSPITIRDIKTIKKACTSLEVPIIITTWGFNEDAINWAKDDNVRLISNKEITQTFKSFDKNSKTEIIGKIWDGREHIPTCPVCNCKMAIKKEHTDPKGNYKTQIWYCGNYGSCHQRITAKVPGVPKEDKIYPDFSEDQREN